MQLIALDCAFINKQQIQHNKRMNSPVLTIEHQRYPFAQSQLPQPAVIQIQHFKTFDELQQKHQELIKKTQLITNPSIIKLITVTQQNMSLIYNYEFVPHSIQSYLRNKFQHQPPEIWTMTKKLFTKKLTFDLTLLTSYLGKMKIQTELGIQHLGVSREEKVKLYVSWRSKMGSKQEIQLIIAYNQHKQKILKELNQLYSLIQSTDNHYQQDNEQAKKATQDLNGHASGVFNASEAKFRQSNSPFSKIPINTAQSFLRQTRNYEQGNSFRPRKMSTDNLEFNSGANLFKNMQQNERASSPKAHKYSFQFGNPSDQSSFKPEKEDEPQPNYSKSKSIKIQLQQKQNMGPKRQRKDSYKVKITTVRQYELGESPTNIFGNGSNNEDDIFQYFAKRSKGKPEEQEPCQDPEKSADNDRKKMEDTNQETTEPSSPFSPLSMKHRKESGNSTSSRNLLEERIRQAKERTSKALNLMKNFKK